MFRDFPRFTHAVGVVRSRETDVTMEISARNFTHAVGVVRTREADVTMEVSASSFMGYGNVGTCEESKI